MKHRAKNSVVLGSLLSGLAIIALCACTSTPPSPEPTVTKPLETGANSVPLSQSQTPSHTPAAASTRSSPRSSGELTFSANSIKIIDHKIVDDPTDKNLQVKVRAPRNTSFFSGTDEAACKADVIEPTSGVPSDSGDDAEPRVTYELQCQDLKPTTAITANISYGDFVYEFVVPLK
jgi:hypothetical protein